MWEVSNEKEASTTNLLPQRWEVEAIHFFLESKYIKFNIFFKKMQKIMTIKI